MEPDRRESVKRLLEEGVREGVFPGAVLLVAAMGQIEMFEEVGNRFWVSDSLPMNRDTIFDLASLTKPLGTTLAIMKLVDEGRIDCDQTLGSLLSVAVPEDKKTVTPRLLLSHCSGFADWKPFYLELEHVPVKKRKEYLRERLLNIPLAYEPGKATLYSDLGFMVLEWMVEKMAGMPLHRFLAKHFYAPLSLENTFFSTNTRPARFEEYRFAPTEKCPWRKKINLGYVDDENAYALGGYSGHAGLFSTAQEVYTLVNLLRNHFLGKRNDYLTPDTVRMFFARQNNVKGSTWALGWDSPSLKDSSSGIYFSSDSVGHLGFTGTSVWMDLKKDVIVIFLTNRVHPTRKNEKIKGFRPLLHNTVMKQLGLD